MVECMYIIYLGKRWNQDAPLKEGRRAGSGNLMLWTMFCWEMFGVQVDVTLTLTTYHNIVVDWVCAFMTKIWHSGRIMRPNTLVREWCLIYGICWKKDLLGLGATYHRISLEIFYRPYLHGSEHLYNIRQVVLTLRIIGKIMVFIYCFWPQKH